VLMSTVGALSGEPGDQQGQKPVQPKTGQESRRKRP
jgi:hypothetical protein